MIPLDPAKLFAEAPVRQPIQIAVLPAAVRGHSATRAHQHLLDLLFSNVAATVVADFGLVPSSTGCDFKLLHCLLEDYRVRVEVVKRGNIKKRSSKRGKDNTTETQYDE
jgi:hypothetical protein